MADKTYNPKIYRKQGGVELHIASGGVLDIEGTTGLQFQDVDVTAQLQNLVNVGGSVAFDRLTKVVKVALAGATIHAGVVAWANPEAGSIIITRAFVDVTTVATGAASLDVGTTAVSNTTASDTLLDGIDVHSATGLLEIGNGDAPGAGNAKNSQKLASGKWVTIKEISGDATGLVGTLYLSYILA